MQVALKINQPIIQDAEAYAIGIAKLRVWLAQIQSLKLASASSNRIKFGYVTHLGNELGNTFGISLFNKTPVLILPEEIKPWFGYVPWKSIVCTAGRLFLIADLEYERIALSFPFSTAISSVINLKKINIMYINVNETFSLDSFIAVNFLNDDTMLSKEDYYDSL